MKLALLRVMVCEYQRYGIEGLLVSDLSGEHRITRAALV
jgi:hypothetical protein